MHDHRTDSALHGQEAASLARIARFILAETVDDCRESLPPDSTWAPILRLQAGAIQRGVAMAAAEHRTGHGPSCWYCADSRKADTAADERAHGAS